MSTHTEMTQTNQTQVDTVASKRSRSPRSSGHKKPHNFRFKTIPPASIPIVKGKEGRNFTRIGKEWGTKITLVPIEEQKKMTKTSNIEINFTDVRVLRIQVNHKVEKEGMNNEQRLFKSCQGIQRSVEYWRKVNFPPPDDDDDGEEDSDPQEQDATEPSSSVALEGGTTEDDGGEVAE